MCVLSSSVALLGIKSFRQPALVSFRSLWERAIGASWSKGWVIAGLRHTIHGVSVLPKALLLARGGLVVAF
jgi:hypothetical protein